MLIFSGMAILLYAIPFFDSYNSKTIDTRGKIYVSYRFCKKYGRIMWIGVFCFLFGSLCMEYTKQKIMFYESLEGQFVQFRGVVIEQTNAETGQYILALKELDGTKRRVSAIAFIEEPVKVGDYLEGTGCVKAFLTATNAGGYDERTYQYGQGRFLKLQDVLFQKKNETDMLLSVLSEFRGQCKEIYYQLLDESNASLATAMVLGDKQDLNQDMKELYQRNGIAHLIAISGLHIAMIGGSFYRLVRRATGNYYVAFVIGGFFVLIYGVMTGLSGATYRAVVMLIVSLGADCCGRKYDSLTAIAIALWIMLVRNPCQVFQVGFLLSFGAVLGIVLIQPIWEYLFLKKPQILAGFFVSVSVQLMLLPVMLYYFYEIPVYGVLLNVVVVPLMSVLLALLILSCLIGHISLTVAMWFAGIANVIFEIYEILCKLFERLPGHTACTGRPEVLWMVAYYMILSFVVIACKKQWKWNTRIAIAGFVICLLYFQCPKNLQICMFDVGQGDSIYVQTPFHKSILIDGGSSSKQKIGQYVLKNGLRYYGAKKLDYVFISHCDNDHYSGIEELLEGDMISICNMVFPKISNPDTSYYELVRLAKNKGCNVYYMGDGERLLIDGVSFLCLNPKNMNYQDKNQGSIVLKLQYKEFDMLFTGDIDAKIEEDILRRINGPVEVLKVPHHGSKSSSSMMLLQEIQPDISLISCGLNNSYGHPDEEVVQRLKSIGSTIFCTKDDGQILIKVKGNKIQIESYLKRAR